LQTRSEKYGRLAHGFLLSIDSNFIKRQKNHFVDFFGQPAIGCIIGTNGYVWVYAKGQQLGDFVASYEERVRMAGLRNAIVALEREKVPIFKETINKVLEEYVRLAIEPKEMLSYTAELCNGAKLLIEEEIGAERPIDFEKLMQEM
jgi:exosome complex RNA-binding protein Rrp4